MIATTIQQEEPLKRPPSCPRSSANPVNRLYRRCGGDNRARAIQGASSALEATELCLVAQAMNPVKGLIANGC